MFWHASRAYNNKVLDLSVMKKVYCFLILAALCCMAHAESFPQRNNIPTIYINTRYNQEPQDKVNELRCIIRVVNGGKIQIADSGYVRLRGNASMSFPKKPYHIRFDFKHNVLGSPASAKRWTLINNYGDKTLMRNILAFDLSRRLEMPYTPFIAAVDVVLNGDYKGCYQLCDQIQVHEKRVEVDQNGYLFEADAYYYTEDTYFWSDRGTPVSIHYPKAENITNAQENAVKSIYNQMEKSGHATVDRSTFLRHFLVGEISGNTDTYWSTYFYKRSTDNMVYTGPVWDFDLAYENDDRTYPICSKCGSSYIYESYGSSAGDMWMIVQDIVNSAEDKQQLESIYAYYRDRGIISVEALTAVVDSLEDLLWRAADDNFQRWPILSTRVHQNPRAGRTYAKEVQWVRDYIAQRIPWMDRKLNYTPNDLKDTESAKPQVVKQIRNGQVVIVRNGEIFDVLGNRIY